MPPHTHTHIDVHARTHTIKDNKWVQQGYGMKDEYTKRNCASLPRNEPSEHEIK